MFVTKRKLGEVVLLTLWSMTAGSLPVVRAEEPPPPKPDQPLIRMDVSAPQFRKPDPVNLPDFEYWEVKVRYKNEGKQEVVLSPFVTLKVFDAANKPVPHDVFIGAGFIGEAWMPMIEKQFLVIPPGKTGEILVNLGDNRSPGGTIGWQFKKAGTYKIVLTYEHSRVAFAKKYFNSSFFFSDDALEKAKLPQRLWNRAHEMERSVDIKLVVGK